MCIQDIPPIIMQFVPYTLLYITGLSISTYCIGNKCLYLGGNYIIYTYIYSEGLIKMAHFQKNMELNIMDLIDMNYKYIQLWFINGYIKDI
jgi:hypothetical protein